MDREPPGSPPLGPYLTFDSRSSTLRSESDEVLEPPSIGKFSRSSTLVDPRIRSSLSWTKESFDYEDSACDDGSVRPTKKKWWKKLFDLIGCACLFSFDGWRVGVTWCAGAAIFSLSINIIWMIWAVAKFGAPNGIGTMQAGSCNNSKNLSQWLHLAINGLSTLLLAGSNYTMQCLSSPTREEVDRAHAKEKWLDIGVPSVRNLFYITKTRCALWWLLAFSGIPLHLLYNSAVYSTLAVQQYDVFAVADRLITAPEAEIRKVMNIAVTQRTFDGGWYKNQTHYEDFVKFRTWEKLNKLDCIKAYGKEFNSDRGDLVVVSPSLNHNRSGIIKIVKDGGSFAPKSSGGWYWMCGQWSQGHTGKTCYPTASLASEQPSVILTKVADQWDSRDPWSGQDIQIDYCLSQKVQQRCTVEFSVAIMYIVIVANMIKACCMLLTLKVQRSAPLVTLGDAIQSFLRDNDPATADKCLADRKYFQQSDWSRQTSLKWQTKRHKWFSGASGPRWIICNTL